ncbi:MAG: hypothetical protein QOH49_4005 [Acidobacteriota bacterium]|nr:hypothetical protein [Acidobacteriota bacterium]
MKAPKYSSLTRVSPTRRGRLRRTTACALTILLLCNAALGASKIKAVRKPAPRVTEARATEARAEDSRHVSFKLTIRGEGFGQTAEAVTLALLNADSKDAVEGDETSVESVTPSKIVAQVVARPGPYSLRLKIGKAAADTSQIGPLAVPTDPKPAVTAEAGDAAPPRGINLEAPEVYAYPSDGGLKRYALVVKRKQGEGAGEFFATDPKLVSLVLTPAGAGDVVVRRVTPTRIEAAFWAPDKYQIKDVGVTIYDRTNPQLIAASSDIKVPDAAAGDSAKDGGKMRAAALGATDDKDKAKEEPPKITSTAVVFLQRAYGIGRLKIEGSGFGNYKAPPVSAEDYLLCFEPLARQALYRALEDGGHPKGEEQQRFEDQRCAPLKTSAEQWQKWRAEQIEPLVKVALVPKNTDLRIEQTKILYVDDKLIDVYFEFNRYYRNSEPLRLASATVTVKKPKPESPGTKQPVDGGSEVAAARRGPDGASLVNAVLTTDPTSAEKKAAPKANDKREVNCALTPCETYIASSEVGASPGLEYTYNVLDNSSAAMLFGKGVAGNFYAILLSVTNNGDKKVSVPLSSVRAEIEWAYGAGDAKSGKGSAKTSAEKSQGVKGVGNGSDYSAKAFVTPTALAEQANADIPSTASSMRFYYEEGPVTLAPLSLQTVTAFFDADEKVNGTKAKIFNYFDGAAILGSSLFPFFGPGFRDAHGAFTGGLIPGMKRGLGDLSGQQLQNLTGMSWQDIEVVGAKGGSVVKYVFIQRGDSSFSPGFNESVKKTIKNIQGMEVKGIEVVEGETKLATHTGQQ